MTGVDRDRVTKSQTLTCHSRAESISNKSGNMTTLSRNSMHKRVYRHTLKDLQF